MKRSTGNTLRLLGGLIEVVFVALIIGNRNSNWQFAGIRVAPMLYAGFFVGLVVWAAGLVLVRRPATGGNPPRD